MSKISFFTALILASSLFSCKNNKETAPVSTGVVDSTVVAEEATIDYAIGTTDETMAKIIANFLVTDYLKEDIKVMSVEDRKFQFQIVDLNRDGNDEVFVNFMTPYFCGTGGCTILLLSSNWEIITQFTVTRTPIAINYGEVEEWANLMVQDNGVWKDLKFSNGSYPSNPSLIEKSEFDAPSGEDHIIFSDEFSPTKTFTF